MRTTQADMKPPGPAKCMGDGDQPTGSDCTNATKCTCSGPATGLTCATSVGMLDLPGGYCTNNGCDTADSTNTCGQNGRCLSIDPNDPAATFCFARCTKKGACKTDYACIFNGSINICLPKDAVSNCNPTADPKSQCTLPAASLVTDDKPNAPCFRSGLDDVGTCQDGQNGENLFQPCNIGPNNCPTGKNCVFVDTSTIGNPTIYGMDKFKDSVCLDLPPANMQKDLDGSCADAMTGGLQLYVCKDNLSCVTQTGAAKRGTCQRNCYANPPTYVGHGGMYKNAEPACPAGKTCTNTYGLTGTSWPGHCL